VDLLRPIRALDRHQQSRKWLAIPFAVLKKFGDDQAGSLAALVAYYAFFSIFPLLLVLVTVLGFVLQGDTGAQDAVKNSVLGQFPVIGEQIQLHELSGNTAALVIGLVTSLIGGMGVTSAAQNAFDRVWAVPFKDRADFLRSRLRGLTLIGALGVLFILATVLSGLVSGLHGPLPKVGGVVVSLIVNFGLFLAAFRFLTSATIPTRCLWIGVAFAAVVWETLQLVGGLYINHVYRHASSTYSQFALVIALLVWLNLGAQMTLYAAEINVVVARKLWPRSLIGPPEAPADEKTLTALAKVEERSDVEQVDVRFDHGEQSQAHERPPAGSRD
jgi:YihY family inner membrane protein